MSYVTVALDEPVTPLTYRLTPATLLQAVPGAIVEVPFGRSAVHGIVLSQNRSVPAEIQSKIRPLIKTISAGPWVPPTTRSLAATLSAECGESLGTCLFRLLPPLGKRSLKRLRPPQSMAGGRRLLCVGSHTERLDVYRSLIRHALEARQQVIIVAPISRHQWLATHLAKISHRITTVTADLAPSQQRRVADDVATGLVDILIGTRHVVGWPAHALGLLIVDDPYHRAHVDDQRPYLDAATIATARSQVSGGHCLLGLRTLTPALMLRSERSLITPIATKAVNISPSFHTPSSQSALVDSVCVTALQRSIAAGQRTVVVAPRHGWGGQLRCLDCGTVARCAHCHGELAVIDPSHTLSCQNCGRHEHWPTLCSHCQGAQLRPSGIGTEAIRAWFNHHEPTLLDKGLEIVTEGAFDEPSQYGTVLFPSADSPLTSPDLNRPIRYLGAIREALGSAQAVFIVTADPNQPWLRSLTSAQNLHPLLDEREAHHLPPYVRTVHLRGPAKSEPTVLTAIEATDWQRRDRRDDHVTVEVLLPNEQYRDWQQWIRTQLPRQWRVQSDSILDHAFPLPVVR
ncbi:hypothetical protein HY524_01185 [Candidatus Berkelbacteria bacterium]|nr:hypothetical protein [Candidatus Berkelbacteria bacterium]